MKNYPIHENLDTSFINLSALIKYLRRQHFTGSVRVEFGDYQAEIVIVEREDNFSVREHDLVSGRVGEGEEALQRLLIRARQAGGIVNVYRHLPDDANSDDEKISAIETNNFPREISQNSSDFEKSQVEINDIPVLQNSSEDDSDSSGFPLNLSNNVEVRAKQNALSPDEWRTLLDLTGELLGTIDRTLADDGLNFGNAFRKAAAEISGDYPFLEREKEIFDYADGKIAMTEQIGGAIFVSAIMEILRRLLGKLGATPKYSEIYRRVVQDILALIRQRKPLYDKFFITHPLEKIIVA